MTPSAPPGSAGDGAGFHAANTFPIGGHTDGPESMAQAVNDPTFDILEWLPAYQSCQRFFLDHSQHEQATQAVCALVNIRLPFQWLSHPVVSSSAPPTASSAPSPSAGGGERTGGGGGGGGVGGGSSGSGGYGGSSSGGGGGGSTGAGAGTHTGGVVNFPFTPSFRRADSHFNSPNAGRGDHPAATTTATTAPPTAFVSVLPYVRRLVVTGFDRPGILHGFFGNDWAKGVMPFVECERRNYLFAAKAGGWPSCKKQYDVGSGSGGAAGDESVPFMKPLEGASAEELEAAERAWSDWLAMEDWMIGPHAPSRAEHPGQHAAQGGAGAGAGGAHRRRGSRADMRVDGEVDGIA